MFLTWKKGYCNVWLAVGRCCGSYFIKSCIITNPSRHPEKPYDVDERWNAEGLEWYAEAYPEKQHWWAWATLILPWHALGGYQAVWRANFYRTERSRSKGTELSCWSPTFSKSFHVPARFGTLLLENIIVWKHYSSVRVVCEPGQTELN